AGFCLEPGDECARLPGIAGGAGTGRLLLVGRLVRPHPALQEVVQPALEFAASGGGRQVHKFRLMERYSIKCIDPMRAFRKTQPACPYANSCCNAARPGVAWPYAP